MTFVIIIYNLIFSLEMSYVSLISMSLLISLYDAHASNSFKSSSSSGLASINRILIFYIVCYVINHSNAFQH